MEGKDTYILLAFALLCWRCPVASLAIDHLDRPVHDAQLLVVTPYCILTSLGCVNGNPSNQGDEKGWPV
jgi:hypothetical protein